jgi:hypothetical protein
MQLGVACRRRTSLQLKRMFWSHFTDTGTLGNQDLLKEACLLTKPCIFPILRCMVYTRDPAGRLVINSHCSR